MSSALIAMLVWKPCAWAADTATPPIALKSASLIAAVPNAESIYSVDDTTPGASPAFSSAISSKTMHMIDGSSKPWPWPTPARARTP
jgi:hypothetical protein